MASSDNPVITYFLHESAGPSAAVGRQGRAKTEVLMITTVIVIVPFFLPINVIVITPIVAVQCVAK